VALPCQRISFPLTPVSGAVNSRWVQAGHAIHPGWCCPMHSGIG
jgi:hypothetical protein